MAEPCACAAGTCKACKCAKKGAFCTPSCHGGKPHKTCLNFDGTKYDPNPLKLSAGALRKELAQRGLSPMGNKTEMIVRLRDALADEGGGGGGGGQGGQGSGGGGGKAKDALLQGIVDLGDQMDYEGILSLAGTEITRKSAVGAMKKAYRRLSIKVHPDKNNDSSLSKKAFQHLVSAFERLSQPELYADQEAATSKKAKTFKISRSNEGCYRTAIHCPRCNMDWGRKELGLEDGAYNWFMMGIREYTCGRCLLGFGCMTARHRCPRCRMDFDYDPADYHRKIVCGNPKCNKPFGFMLYHVSDRREREVRREQKELVEKMLKKRSVLKRRAERAGKRSRNHVKASLKAFSIGGDEDPLDEKQREEAFKQGLSDTCPRCGYNVLEDTSADAQKYPIKTARNHIKSCTDASKHKRYKAQKVEERKKAKQKLSLEEKQTEQMLLSTWEFQGSKPGQLWTLTDGLLRRLCERYKLDEAGERLELIKRISSHLRTNISSHLLTDGSGAGTKLKASHTLADADPEDLPSNLHELTVEQLQALCASYGISCTSNRKATLIKAFEKARFSDQPQLLLSAPTKKRLAITSGRRDRKQSNSKKQKKNSQARQVKRGYDDDSDDDDDDDDSDFDPDDDAPLTTLRQRKRQR